MPTYLVDLVANDGVALGNAGGPSRCPEVGVEHWWVDHDDARRQLVVCRAPSDAHLRQWLADVDAAVQNLRIVHPARLDDVNDA